jgi:hypothetical protein
MPSVPNCTVDKLPSSPTGHHFYSQGKTRPLICLQKLSGHLQEGQDSRLHLHLCLPDQGQVSHLSSWCTFCSSPNVRACPRGHGADSFCPSAKSHSFHGGYSGLVFGLPIDYRSSRILAALLSAAFQCSVPPCHFSGIFHMCPLAIHPASATRQRPPGSQVFVTMRSSWSTKGLGPSSGI